MRVVTSCVFVCLLGVQVFAGEKIGHVTFSGTLLKGEKFDAKISENYRFELLPAEYGWEIKIRDLKRPEEDLSRLTPPINDAANPRYIAGWHFRNKDNSGPVEGGLYASQLIHEFYFSPEVGLTMKHPLSPKLFKKLVKQGKGLLTIKEIQLSNLEPGQKAIIDRMTFEVTLKVGF